MKEITDANFNSEVLHSPKPVVVDFYTDMCQPCKMMAPILEKMNEDNDGFEVVKFDAYEGSMPEKYDIVSVPTLILFTGGKEIARREGSAPQSVIETWIEISLDR